MAKKHVGMAALVTVMALPVFAVLYFKWNADGPGTEGGEDRDRKVEAPMAAPEQGPQQVGAQRRRERAAISGRVHGVDDGPIAGALVCAAASSTLLSADDTREPRCVHSGSDGRYRLDDLFGVRQRVSAGAAGYLPADHVKASSGLRRRAIDLRPGSEVDDVDLTLVRGGVEIRGRVLDLHGAAITDAWVASGGPESGTGVAWARSGADGHYVLWVRPGTATVRAQAAGHVASSVTGPSEGHAFTVFLPPASVLRGKVVVTGERASLAGVWVYAGRGGEVVRTDAAGNFRFDTLAPGVYRPRVETDDGFGMAGEQVLLGLGETSSALTIAVRKAVFVEGRIVHEDGASCDDGALMLREMASGREVGDTTEPGGLVHVRGLLPGTYTAQVTCKGTIADDAFPIVVVRDRDLLAQTWTLRRGRTIAGVLVDAAGAPVVGVTIEARAVDRTSGASAVVSDDEGRFLLRGLVAGRYEITPVSHPRRTMPDAPVIVEVADADVAGLQVPLVATGELRGSLRDRQGRTIAGATLALGSGRGAQQTVTGEHGGFHFASAAAGDSTLAVTLGGAPLAVLAHARVVVAAGATTTTELIAAAPTGAITGTLRDASGQPLVGALVEARAVGAVGSEDGDGLWRVGGERPTLSDAAGMFTIEGLTGAAYTVVAHAWGGGLARSEPVRAGKPLALKVAAGGRVTGTVALHGRGMPESFLVDVRETSTGRRRSEDFIATEGVWGFAGLPHGTYELRVRAREGMHEQPLVFAAGEELTGVRVELVGATTLRGSVLDLDGAPVAGLEVVSSSVRGRESDTKYVTDEAGQFELLRVPVGPISLTVEPPHGQRGLFGAVRIAVEVQAYQRVIDVPPIRVARRRLAPGEARGDLGFTIPTGKAGADPLLADLKVASIRHDGPAAASGLLVHDEIVAVDGHDVRGANRSLYTTLSEVPVGTSLRLGLARGVTVELVAGTRR